jgi:hypothetical protein
MMQKIKLICEPANIDVFITWVKQFNSLYPENGIKKSVTVKSSFQKVSGHIYRTKSGMIVARQNQWNEEKE